MSERWRQIEDLYLRALKHPQTERATFLETACAGDESLRQEVESLLLPRNDGNFRTAAGFDIAAHELAKTTRQDFIGKDLGSYKVLSLIGVGGMGEVYRAKDLKLGRHVAIKFLPEALSHNSERVARFEREARALALLNHPNIAAIYGLETSGECKFLVMELVEGETLAKRIRHKAISVSEALQSGKQICEAVETAHEKGIIHRDLKPGNIMIDADGKVKVLDFGLAKIVMNERSSPTGAPLSTPLDAAMDSSQSPTVLTDAHTQAHILIGTAAYMSPEQARGHMADYQSDIWAFGCVLYEMLTGKQVFTGETVTDLIGGIVRIEPDWTALPAGTPDGLRGLLKRCLQKDRRQRFHAIGDVRIEIEQIQSGSGSQVVAPSRNRERIAWTAAAVLAVATVALLLAGFHFYSGTGIPPTARFVLDFASATFPATANAPSPAVSPDGRYVAFYSFNQGPLRLWLRPIGSTVAQVIPGTEGIAPINSHPFWSPDSHFIGFFADGKLKKVAANGGPPLVLCDATGDGITGTWNQEDVIVFQHLDSLYRVSAAGGVSSPVRMADRSNRETVLRHPSFLPDGRHFLYLAVGSVSGANEVRVGTLDSDEDKSLFTGSSRVLYAPPGYLIFARNATLMAQPFNARSLALTGNAFPVAESVSFNAGNGVAAFGVSQTGTLIYRTVGPDSSADLTWFDRDGTNLNVVQAVGDFINMAISPDQTHIAGVKSADRDIWSIDLLRGTNSRFTFDGAQNNWPVFSVDGKQIVYVSNRSGKNNLYVKATSGAGTAERLSENVADGVSDWSPDGKLVLYAVNVPWDVWVLPMTGDRKPYPILNDPKSQEYRAKFSPDGRWFLYTSNETGRNEIYVQTFPPSGGKWQVSVGGGEHAYWRRDGKEIVFSSSDNKIMSVETKLGTTFEAGVPRQLFQISNAVPNARFAITPNAQRFLVPVTSSQVGSQSSMTVVLNWTSDIRN